MDEQLRDDIELSAATALPPGEERSIRVLVVDPRPAVRQALCDVIGPLGPRITVAGFAETLEGALGWCPSVRPDVVLVGLSWVAPGAGAARRHLHRASEALTSRECELVRLIVAQPGAKYAAIAGALGVTVHTVHNHLTRIYVKLDVANRSELLARVLGRDAAGSPCRDGPGAGAVVLAGQPAESFLEELLQASAARPGAWPSSRAEAASGAPSKGRTALLASLTAREYEVFEVLGANPGAKYFTIAAHLGISEHTVHNHLSSIYQKLQVVNRNDLLAYAVRNGIGAGQSGRRRSRP